MSSVRSFEDLKVWQKGCQLYKEIFEITKRPEFNQDFDLRRQLRKSAGSIPDNIAEGYEREGNREYRQFLSISKGSAGELRSQIHRAYIVEFVSTIEMKDLKAKAEEVSRMLKCLMNYISNSEIKGSKFMEPEPNYGQRESFKP
ncbi:MAG: four helix bundle protein [Bacteroidia bacterium]